MNERTNTLLYKNISLTLYSPKGWCWLCVRGELETGTDCFLTQSSSDHSSTSFSSWLGCSTVGHWEPKALCLPLVLNSTSCLQLTQVTSGTWLCNCLTFTYFRCSSVYLHRCISWLTARSRVNMLHTDQYISPKLKSTTIPQMKNIVVILRSPKYI